LGNVISSSIQAEQAKKAASAALAETKNEHSKRDVDSSSLLFRKLVNKN